MSTISYNDFILATEMQLIYNNITGFEPVNNNLSHWKGTVGVIEGTSIPIYADIIIPPEFPNRPPKITITPKLNHPNVDDNGNISLRITAQWVPTVHVYQVINELRKLFSRVPAKPYRTKKQRRSAPRTPQPTRLPVHPISTYPVQPRMFTAEQAMNQEEVEKRTLQEEIEEYQKQIEELNQAIERERVSLLQQSGVSVAKNGKELAISREDDLKAELFATRELLETLKEKFEDGDLSAVDYFKLYKKYSKGEYTAEKKLTIVKSKESGKMTGEHEKQMELEAELFATIATLDTLAKSYENNEIEQVAYKKQLRALIKDIFKIRMKLERITKFDITEFIEREKLDEKYPKGIKHLRMAEGTETAEAEVIPVEALKKMLPKPKLQTKTRK